MALPGTRGGILGGGLRASYVCNQFREVKGEDMNKIFLISIVLLLSGCSRSFWAPGWDKAETERQQYEQLQKQNVTLERIATALETLTQTGGHDGR